MEPVTPKTNEQRDATRCEIASRWSALRLLPCGLGLWIVLSSASLGAQEVANRDRDLKADAREFIHRLVNEFGYTDLARRWIGERMEVASKQAQAELEWFLVDCDRVEGNLDAFREGQERLGRLYPTHPRAAVSRLSVEQANLADLLRLARDVGAASTEADRKELRKQRDALFTQIVSSATTMVAAVRKKTDPTRADLLWEQFLVRIHLLYGKALDGEPEARKVNLQKAYEGAEHFVSNYFGYAFDLACEAQLLKAQTLVQLGQSEDAADAFDTLVTITPPIDPPYSKDVQKFILGLRLRAAKGTGEAWNAAGRPDQAVEAFDFFTYEDPDYDLKLFDDDPLIQSYLLSTRIEEAVSRMAGGDYSKGRATVLELLQRYANNPSLTAEQRAANEGAVQEINEGLSRMLDAGASGLDAELYYRGGIGYKGRLQFDEALHAWRLALAAGQGDSEQWQWVALSIFEIGETSYILDRPEEAGLAFLLFLNSYSKRKIKELPRENLGAKASQNAFAIFGAITGDASAYRELEKEAEEYFNDYGTGQVAELLKLQRALELENKAKYDDARRAYLSVAKEVTVGGVTEVVKYYYSARSSAARCLFREALNDGKVDNGRRAAVQELRKLDQEAAAEGDMAGRATARYEWARCFWPESKDHRDPKEALAALAPFKSEIRVRTEHRNGALALWVDVLLSDDEIDKAEEIFVILERDFSQETSVAIVSADLIDAHRGRGKPQDLKRSAELAQIYVKSPHTNTEAMELGELWWLAQAMIDGGKGEEAVPLLNLAQQRMPDDADAEVEVDVAYLLGKAANQKDPEKAIEGMLAVYEKHTRPIQEGLFENAPRLLRELAAAEIKLHSRRSDGKRLDRALEYLVPAVLIFEARHVSLRPNVPPGLDREYWSTEYQRLEVMKAQGKNEMVVNEIKTLRIRSGGKDFAPPELQARFDALQKECE